MHGPLHLQILFRFGTEDAARWGCWRVADRDRDWDNLGKLVSDALGDAGAFADDGQIAHAATMHEWSRPWDAGCAITLRVAAGKGPMV